MMNGKHFRIFIVYQWHVTFFVILKFKLLITSKITPVLNEIMGDNITERVSLNNYVFVVVLRYFSEGTLL